MAQQKQLLAFGFEQTIDEKYWNWSDAEKKAHFTDAKSIMKRICARIHIGLQQAGASGEALKFEFAAINHDKDVDFNEATKIFTPKREHIHGVVTLQSKRDINVIAQWIGLEPVKIEIPRGRYGKENMLAYLIHAKDPKKYQYDPTEVETFGTFDYMAYYKGKKSTWEKRKATVQAKDNKEAAEWLKMQVQQGQLTVSEIMANEEFKYVYADNMRLIDDAARFYAMDKGYKTLKDFQDGKFDMTVIFVTGESNAGKSNLARQICKGLELMKGWKTHEASASNPLDEYDGQEILYLDEVRPYSFAAVEWLLMLQPGGQTLKARYYNKRRAHKVVIITSPVEDPYTFFNQVRGANQEIEPLNQFIRRLTGHIHVAHAGQGKRYATYSKVGRSDFPLLYNPSTKGFVTPEDAEILSNGVPVLDEDAHANYTEYPYGPRKVDFGLVPYAEGYIEKDLIPDAEEPLSLVDGIMKEVLKDAYINNDPNIKHDRERPPMQKILGEAKLNNMAVSLGMNFKSSEGDD